MMMFQASTIQVTGPKVLFSFSIIQDQVLLSKSDGNLALRSTWLWKEKKANHNFH